MFCGAIASWKLESKCKRLLWTERWYFKLLWKFLNITHRSCNNQLVTTELVVQCRKFQWLTELREWKTQKNVKFVHVIKCAKVRELFAENYVRFARRNNCGVTCYVFFRSLYSFLYLYCVYNNWHTVIGGHHRWASAYLAACHYTFYKSIVYFFG